MTRTRDAVHLVQLANPVPDADRLPDGPRSPRAQAVLTAVLATEPSHAEQTPPRRRTAVLLAVALLVLGASAAWAYGVSGIFPDPAFSGETWKLTVGEERNGINGDTYKVCHSFERRVGADMGNGLGVSGCGDWPASRQASNHGPAIIEVVPALQTPQGQVLFVDLTARAVATVSATPDVGPTVDVRPYRMPQTGKQYAVVELGNEARSATVRALDSNGRVIETRRVRDLNPR